MPPRRSGVNGSLRPARGFFLVLTTASSPKEAARLAQRLVRSRHAACVNVVPGITSHYRWKGKLESSRETLLLIKTTAARLRPLALRLKQWHSYDLPELLALPIAAGSSDYLRWLQSSLSGAKAP